MKIPRDVNTAKLTDRRFCQPKGWLLKSLGISCGLAILFTILSYSSCNTRPVSASEFDYTDEEIADAVYKAENSIKYPYGIKSIPTYGNKEYARKICLNSIRNAKKRWIKAGKPEDFIVFMGRRYSPPEINPNWVRLVNYFLKRNRNEMSNLSSRNQSK